LKFNIILHSILREKLPPEAHGHMELDLPDGSTIADVAKSLELPEPFIWVVNGELNSDITRKIQDGDELRFLRPSSGG
jgi:sulfur carrier protein ThiS